MAKYWSESTSSFYDSNVCAVSQMPSDAAQITDTEYKNLMELQAAGYKIVHNTSTGEPEAIAQSLTEATATVHEVTNATSAVSGHVKLSDATNSTSASGAGVAATPAAVKAVADAKAPNNHASTATTYGIGTGSNYGHVKLSDSTSSTSAATAGIAASPKAVKAVQDAVTTLDGKVVHLDGAESVIGVKTFKTEIWAEHSITNAKNKSSVDEFQSAMIFRDKQGQAFGHLQSASYADTGDVLVKLSAVTGLRKSTQDETTHYIGMGMRLDGTPYTTAPTPPANDDSTQIATTEWVGDNNAGSATKLKTARTIRTDLASTSTASFDGSGNVTPGVTGVLPLANGGTGSSTKNFVDLTSAQSIGGTKTFTGAIKAGVDALISHADDASVVRIDGGSGWDKGACILLYGKDEASYKGQGKFRVTDGTNTKEAIFKPDGTLTWDGKNVVTAAGTGLSQSTNTLSLATVVTAGTAGPTANATPAFGATFTVPKVSYDAYGRVTGHTNYTVKIPAAPSTAVSLKKSGTIANNPGGVKTVSITGLTALKPVFIAVKSPSSIGGNRFGVSSGTVANMSTDAGLETGDASTGWLVVVPTGTSITLFCAPMTYASTANTNYYVYQ